MTPNYNTEVHSSNKVIKHFNDEAVVNVRLSWPQEAGNDPRQTYRTIVSGKGIKKTHAGNQIRRVRAEMEVQLVLDGSSARHWLKKLPPLAREAAHKPYKSDGAIFIMSGRREGEREITRKTSIEQVVIEKIKLRIEPGKTISEPFRLYAILCFSGTATPYQPGIASARG